MTLMMLTALNETTDRVLDVTTMLPTLARPGVPSVPTEPHLARRNP